MPHKTVTTEHVADTHLLTSVTLRFADGIGPNPFAVWAIVVLQTDKGAERHEMMIEHVVGGVIGGDVVPAPGISPRLVRACRRALVDCHGATLAALGYDEHEHEAAARAEDLLIGQGGDSEDGPDVAMQSVTMLRAQIAKQAAAIAELEARLLLVREEPERTNPDDE